MTVASGEINLQSKQDCICHIQCSRSESCNVSEFHAVLSIGPGTCQSSGGYSVESWRVYLTFKNSPGRNSRGLLILLRRVLF